MSRYPKWFKENQPEFYNNNILYCCANAGMSAEDALLYLATGYDELLKMNIRLTMYAPEPVVFVLGDKDE